MKFLAWARLNLIFVHLIAHHPQACWLLCHLFSPGCGSHKDEWLRLQHPGTSVDSTAYCSEPGGRDGPGLPPHSPHPCSGGRTSAGATNRELEVLIRKWESMHLKISLGNSISEETVCVKFCVYAADKTHINKKPWDVSHPLSTVSPTVVWEKENGKLEQFCIITAGERGS